MISYQNKVVFSVIFVGLCIFFKPESTGELLPKHSFFAVIFVMIGVTLNYYDPLFLPLFLLLLYIYSQIIGI